MIYLKSGYYDIEKDQNTSFRWMKDKFSFNVDPLVEFISLIFLCEFDGFKLKLNNSEFLIKKGINKINFKYENVSDFECDFFIPSKIRMCNDDRVLSIRLYGIELKTINHKKFYFPIEKIVIDNSAQSIESGEILFVLPRENKGGKPINICLKDGFYGYEDVLRNGNISRWMKKKSLIKILSNINDYDCLFKFNNHNSNNKSITIKSGNVVKDFALNIGFNILKFKCYNSEIYIESENFFIPKSFGNSTDDRELSIVLDNLNINSTDISITNEIYTDNIKDVFVSNINFNEKFILGKRVGIICYIPRPTSTGNEQIFLKNINEHKSFSDIAIFSEFPWKNSIEVEDPLTVIDINNLRSKYLIGIWTFFKALKIAKDLKLDYFMTIESDCRFTKKDWDYDIFKFTIENDAYFCGSLNIAPENEQSSCFNYLKQNEIIKSTEIDETKNYKSFPILLQGSVPGKNKCYMWTNGAITVYNTNVVCDLIGENIENIIQKWDAWDLDICKLLIDKFGFENSKNKILHYDKIASNEVKSVSLKFSLNNKKNYSAIHPIKTRWKPPVVENYSFYHGGDLGDIIYSLPAIKTIGGGNLILGNMDEDNCKVHKMLSPREFFNKDKYNFIKPLLEKLPYIYNINYSHDKFTYDYNFNEFRYFWHDSNYRSNKKIDRLIDVNLDFVGVLELFDDKNSWINLDVKNEKSKYVVARSVRYRDDNFPWKEIYKHIKNDCIFLGLKSEHELFCKEVGFIQHYIVKDALEMCEIINGCDVFIGNQSFPMSLALALNKPIIQEYCSYALDCLFTSRTNFKTKENYKDLL